MKMKYQSIIVALAISITIFSAGCFGSEPTPTLPIPTIPPFPTDTPEPTLTPTPKPTATTAPTDTPTPDPTPTRDPALYRTPTPDAYALGYRPINPDDNRSFVDSLEEDEAACVHENINPTSRDHIVAVATTNANPDRYQVWACLTSNTKNRIIVAKLAPDTSGISPEGQACIAQMTAETNHDDLWEAIHHQGRDTNLHTVAANLAYAASSCLSEESLAHPTEIGPYSTAMTHTLECLISQVGNPIYSALALKRGLGHTPSQAIDDAWTYCKENR